MTRRQRIVIPGWVHHVTQRGNHQQSVFLTSNDRTVYLGLCAKYFHKYQIRLISFTLMTNHVHLVVIPETKSSLSDGIGQLHHDFALWQNMKCHTNGHLWQNRFYSAPVEEDRIRSVIGYVELNPVRARMVPHAWDWIWSSAHAHVTGNDSSGLLDMDFWKKRFKSDEWKEYLEQTAKDKIVAARIRYATMKGLFYGSEATAIKLEQELGLQLRLKKRRSKAK